MRVFFMTQINRNLHGATKTICLKNLSQSGNLYQKLIVTTNDQANENVIEIFKKC